MTDVNEREVIAPASLPQELFINSDADITIASGSAGSSKSYSILLRFLRFVHDPQTRGIIFRRTLTQIETQGGLWEEAIALYSKIDKNLKVRMKDKKLVFSNGASLKFSHYENEAAKEKFKGLQADFIAFDEATEFTEEMITYLIGRNRNTKVKHKATVCMATNPHCESFLKDWVWGWLDPETGIPDPDKRGKTRYYAKDEAGNMLWYETKEEAEAVFGVGEDNGVKSVMVIGSTCLDNPYIPPAYISSLKAQSRVERDRLLYGSWTAKEEKAGYFKQSWLEPVKHANGRATARVRAWDLASSLPSETYKNPDWTAGVLMSKDKDKIYTIEHVRRFRDRFMGVEKAIIEQGYEDGFSTIILIPLDAGSGGNSYAKSLQAKLAELGFVVRLVKPKLDKVTRFGAFSAIAEAGHVRYVEDEWNKLYFAELEGFDGAKKNKDDQCDATSDAFNHLRITVTLPNFVLTSFTQENRFSRD